MKKLTRGHVIGGFLFAVLCVIMVIKISSVFALRADSGIARQNGANGYHNSPAVQTAPAAPVFYSNFPLELALTPIPADPWDMLVRPVETWRDSRFELFSWDRFPELLLMDISTQKIQDRLLKRMAFFVEKAGFRGRVWRDEDIAHRHAWNAHNYQALDLAVFFQYARDNDFPLLDEEWELEAILLSSGVLQLDAAARLVPGNGAILSLSRESTPALRTRFMAHEMFHGLFFIDSDFQKFSRQRWEAFPEHTKKFFIAFLDILTYSTDYEYLVINEFMAYMLQLPASQASWYFGQHLSNRLYNEGFGHLLPAHYQMRDGMRFWPEIATIFTAEAETFSRYVNERWGLEAGRVWKTR
ncbi:MAG: hypothetical protein FWD91_06625 [Treponema sp.]|nr:hypothetical protein [Treponema sp.]